MASPQSLQRHRPRRGSPDYRRYWLALRRRDVALAERIFERAMTRLTRPQLYLRFLAPALNLSGVEWEKGRIHWRDEHFVTFHTLRFMRRARRGFVVARPTGAVAVATGVAQENHRIGLRMVCDFLQAENWKIEWLWENQRAVLRDVIRSTSPRLLLLSIGMAHGIEPARRLVRDARRHAYAGLVIVGGRAVDADPGLVAHLGADFTARSGLDLVRKLRQLNVAADPTTEPSGEYSR